MPAAGGKGVGRVGGRSETGGMGGVRLQVGGVRVGVGGVRVGVGGVSVG